MLKIDPAIVHGVQAAEDPSDLHKYLQGALELEHATIPAYLTAYYSIKAGQNTAAAKILRSIVMEEMLHFAIAANLLNALGGSPAIDTPDFIPAYPGPLPMGVHEGLQVGLSKLTLDVVENVFMEIEEPEHPLHLPVGEPVRLLGAVGEEQYATIGLFYAAIGQKIQEFGSIPGDPARQVTNPAFPAKDLFAITTVEQALAAIEVIVEQGEGTTTSPIDPDGDPAHYYRFGEILHGRLLVADPSSPDGYSYSGAAVPLDPDGVYDLIADPRSELYPEDSRARMLSDKFNASYTNLLRALHDAFNGSPGNLDAAIGVMWEMRLTAQELVATAVPNSSAQAAPTFEYQPVGN